MTELLAFAIFGIAFFVALFQEGQIRQKDAVINILQQQLVDLARRCPKP